ncbi:hypothetical protein [Streptomyces sp. NBC_00572]|uniref:hypothetical protein n=1 Tax=Streptomyces sp. NBC_00572 TaxID=2903664 RepID=UPI00224EDE3E|nr:hypothetical protein [Streptomyces sp. NBC_00572]MCX4983164.1 hypothetical protein [Streptomyces sp. NBC_00572]
MTRAVRWLVVALATAATFGVCVWVVRAVSWGWLPQGEGPRLDTALTFGAVTAAAVLAAGGWWASRELPQPVPAPAPAPQRVRKQQATTSGKAQVTLVGGSRNLAPSTGPQPPGTPTADAPARVDQDAEASDDSSVLLVGGHLGPTPDTPADGIPTEVEQRAKASGQGRIVIAGGDQHVEGP